MKYDLNQDLTNSATALGKLLARVPKHSDVLELGAATGYMTEYMKRQLGCRVSIVEIDPDAYRQAAQHAEDGFCGDLQQREWCEHFSGKAFDCVMLSNVLEHVRNPLEILQQAKRLLKPTGRLLIAVPNVAHNDVILNQLNEDWHYTNLGLLDRDHVYFYGHNNILDMIAAAGFAVVEEEFVYLATKKTEQRPPCGQIPEAVMAYLRQRWLGEVYQFVIEARPAEAANDQAPRIIEDRDNVLMASEDYAAHLETDLAELRSYAEQLRTRAEADRAAAVAYQQQLEKDLTESRTYIDQMEVSAEQNRAAAAAYAERVEKDMTGTRAYAEHVEKDLAESRAYTEQLEKDLAESRAYILKLEADMAAVTAEKAAGVETCAEYKEKYFAQMERLQRLEMEHKGVCNQLEELQQEHEKMLQSPVWKMSKPLVSLTEAIVGKKEEDNQ